MRNDIQDYYTELTAAYRRVFGTALPAAAIHTADEPEPRQRTVFRLNDGETLICQGKQRLDAAMKTLLAADDAIWPAHLPQAMQDVEAHRREVIHFYNTSFGLYDESYLDAAHALRHMIYGEYLPWVAMLGEELEKTMTSVADGRIGQQACRERDVLESAAPPVPSQSSR